MQSIEKELLERLKRGVYGDIYNYPVKEYNKVLDMEGLQAASEDEEEEVKWFRLIYIYIYIKTIFFLSSILKIYYWKQEPEIEYVEGYEELEEEDDIEDFGGLEIDESLKDEDLGKYNFMFSGAFDVIMKMHNHPISPHKCMQMITDTYISWPTSANDLCCIYVRVSSTFLFMSSKILNLIAKKYLVKNKNLELCDGSSCPTC